MITNEKMPAAVTDVIEKTIGTFGKYQALILFLLILGGLQTNYQLYSYVFILPKVNYICMDENADNVTNHCPCENPQYDQSEIISSVTSEWNLICDRTVLASLAQSTIQLGNLPGGIVCGYLSDRYGRKLIICWTFLLATISILVSVVTQNVWTFIATRFVCGFAVGGLIICKYVYLMEITGPSFRTFVNICYQSGNIFSYFSISLIAYFAKKWRFIQLLTAAPGILVILCFWILPESPRWLITVGRTEEAVALLTKISRRNGLPTDNIRSIINETKAEFKRDQEQRGSLIDLFKTPKLRLYSVSVAFLWMICCHVYYGINQYVGRLQGNLFLNTMLSALCLTPTLVMFVLFTKYFKRKVGLLICFLMMSSSLTMFILTPNSADYWNLTFVILGQLGAYTALSQIYLYSSEIFPTMVRNSGLGFASMAGRLGSFSAPFDVNIGIDWVPISLFIVLPLFGILLCYFLPETKDTVFQNTIEQAEATRGKNFPDKISELK